MMGDYAHDYAVLYKTLSWQSGVRVSLYGFDSQWPCWRSPHGKELWSLGILGDLEA